MFWQGNYLQLMSPVASPVTLTGTSDLYVFPSFLRPVDVVAFGFIVTTALVDASGAVMSLDRRITPGSDTGRIAGTSYTPAATITLAASSAEAIGKVVYGVADYTGGDPTKKGWTPIQCSAGDSMVLVFPTTAPTTGAGQVFIEYRPRDEQGTVQGANVAYGISGQGQSSGGGAGANRIADVEFFIV